MTDSVQVQVTRTVTVMGVDGKPALMLEETPVLTEGGSGLAGDKSQPHMCVKLTLLPKQGQRRSPIDPQALKLAVQVMLDG